MGSIKTKLLIADSLIELCGQVALGKVSVSDIVAKSGKNRKTFYYHFADKSQLVAWIFRYDVGAALASTVRPDQLVYTGEEDDSWNRFPYYTFVSDGVCSIDGTPFSCTVLDTLARRRSFYSQALADPSPSGLPAYLRGLYVPAIESDIDTLLSDRFLAPQYKRFLAEYHFEALLGYATVFLSQRGHDCSLGEAGPFANIVHDSIADAIARQQQARARRAPAGTALVPPA